MQGLARDIIKPNDPNFNSIPPQILNDDRHMPHFKVICYVFFNIYFVIKILICILFFELYRCTWCYSYLCNCTNTQFKFDLLVEKGFLLRIYRPFMVSTYNLPLFMVEPPPGNYFKCIFLFKNSFIQ